MEIFHPSSIKQNRDGTGNNRLIFPAISTFTIKITGISMNEDSTVKYLARITTKDSSYNSYANLDLTESVARSLHDSDMQQWQAVKDALKSFEKNSVPIRGFAHWGSTQCYSTIQQACIGFSAAYGGGLDWYASYRSGLDVCYKPDAPNTTPTYTVLEACQKIPVYAYQFKTDGVLFESSEQAYTISYPSISQKIITNASSSDQAISLLAETYIEAVASSIFSIEVAKQFVKLADLISQFKINKV